MPSRHMFQSKTSLIRGRSRYLLAMPASGYTDINSSLFFAIIFAKYLSICTNVLVWGNKLSLVLSFLSFIVSIHHYEKIKIKIYKSS